MVKKVQKQKLVTGKDHAKFNKRQRFYNKFLRLVNNLKENDELESIISLTMKKKSVFPEYDDLSMLFLDLVSDQEEGEIMWNAWHKAFTNYKKRTGAINEILSI